MATVATSSQPTNITVEQGATFALSLNAKFGGSPMNLTGATVVAKIRRAFGDSSALVAFTTAVTAPATDGKLTVSLTAAQTAALTPLQPSQTDRDVAIGHWDLEVTTSDGTTRQMAYGTVRLRQWASA